MFGQQQKVENPESLMQQYKQTHDVYIRNQLVMHYCYIAQSMAVQMRGIASNYAQIEDIVNQGMITLIDCIERFEPGKGVKFESYAYMRVKGSIIDFIRSQDWIPRRVRKTAKEVSIAHDTLSNQLLREPTLSEMANHLGISESAMQKHYFEIAQSVTLSFEGIVQNVTATENAFEDYVNEETIPETSLLKQELKKVLGESIDSLNEKERTVVTLYYYENLNLKEIAQVLGVSESRVCQIHSKVILKLQAKMNAYMKG